MRSKEDQKKLDNYDKYFNQLEGEVLKMVSEIDLLWTNIKLKIEKESKNDWGKKSIFDYYHHDMLEIKKQFQTFNTRKSREESMEIITRNRPEFKKKTKK